jgi:hypothetical protein
MVSDELAMYEFVSVIRHASLLVSSRYHAIVTTMAAGVPSIGITMDERIHNLLHDRGHQQYLLRVDAEELGGRLLEALRALDREGDRVGHECLSFVPGQIRAMGQMGIDFNDEVVRVYPDFPARDVPRSWEQFIPPLSPDLQRLLGEHA